MWVAHHVPALPCPILDMGSGDGRIGKAFGASWYVDLDPLPGAPKETWIRNVFSLTRADFGGKDISIVGNPDFQEAHSWLGQALDLAGETGDVSFVLRTGVCLFAQEEGGL